MPQTTTASSSFYDRSITYELQKRLLRYGANSCCPYCKSHNIYKHGTNNGVKRFKCRDCGKSFSVFTGTILEKSKYSWDIIVF